MGMAVWLLDPEDHRVVWYWELQGMRLALNDLARKYWGLLPDTVRKAVQRALNDIEAQITELEGELTSIVPDKRLLERSENKASAENPGVARCEG